MLRPLGIATSLEEGLKVTHVGSKALVQNSGAQDLALVIQVGSPAGRTGARTSAQQCVQSPARLRHGAANELVRSLVPRSDSRAALQA